MVIIAIIVISIILMALFVAVTIAGGRSHDQANEKAALAASTTPNPKSAEQEHGDG